MNRAPPSATSTTPARRASSRHVCGVGLGSRRTALGQQARGRCPGRRPRPSRAAARTPSRAGPAGGEASRRCWPGCVRGPATLPCATSSLVSSRTKKRVAAAPPPHLAAHLRGHGRAGDRGDHGLDVGRIEAGERELLRAAGQLDELVGRLLVAVGAEQQHPARRQRPGQEPEQPQRRLVGPLQIVEDDHQRPPAGEGLQGPGHRLEQPELRIRGGDHGST